jgi:hypothetical protein
MKRIVALPVFAALVLIFCLHVQPATVCAQADAPAVVDNLLAQSGYTFVKKSNKSGTYWALDFTGKSLSKFRVLMGASDDLLIMGVVIATRSSFELTPELTYKLAKINNRFDRIKAGLDNDDDIFVRIELSPRTLDVKEFKVNVDQLRAAADEIYADIRQYIKTTQ